MLSALTGLSIWAAAQTLTGQISDSMCGKSHPGMGEMGKNAKECTPGCVEAGGKYVFVSGDKVYDIKNQNFAAIAANAGANVQLTGDVATDGKTITVTKIAPVGNYETRHLDEGGGRPDCGEKLTVRTGSGFPLRDIGQHDSRPHHSVEGKTSVHDSIRDDLKATSRLAIDVARTGYASVCRDRRSA